MEIRKPADQLVNNAKNGSILHTVTLIISLHLAIRRKFIPHLKLVTPETILLQLNENGDMYRNIKRF